jgi:DNA-binding transcriptional regulator YiaG
MPNLAVLLKDEIGRLARKEVRSSCGPLQDQVRDLKKTVRQQRDTISRLEREMGQLKAISAKPSEKILSAPDVGDSAQIRLSASSIKKHRKRLKLSQTELGKLLNVSTNTIVRWEAGTSKPRAAYRPGIAQLRTMGVREVKKMLGD